jgi:hypothetical protein
VSRQCHAARFLYFILTQEVTTPAFVLWDGLHVAWQQRQAALAARLAHIRDLERELHME